MDAEKVYQMSFGKIYPLLVGKAERKGRTREEVDQIIAWLTAMGRRRLKERLTRGSVTEISSDRPLR